MQTLDVTSLLGHRCQLMVTCPACGGTHVHEGTMTLARRPGEILVDGHAYALGQVRAVVALPEVESVTVPRAVLDLILLGGLALAVVSALRLWT